MLSVFSLPHFKVVFIEHGRLRPTEEDGADRDPGHQLDDGGVGLILLWLRYPQQAGQETVPLMDLVTCRILNIKMTTLHCIAMDETYLCSREAPA